MNIILEEYGTFILEVIGGVMFLGLAVAFFLHSPMQGMVETFTASVVGGV